MPTAATDSTRRAEGEREGCAGRGGPARPGRHLSIDVADVDAALRVEEDHVVVALRDDAHVQLLVLRTTSTSTQFS